MNTVVLNEKEYAEERIRNNNIVDGDVFTLQLLARYYYHEQGLRNKKIAKKLIEFFSSASNSYSRSKFFWDEKIRVIASKAGKRPLLYLDCVWVTKQEFEKIATLQDKVLERLAFTWLCLSKYFMAKNERSNGWVTMSISDIYKLANVSCSTLKKNLYIGALHDAGFLEYAKDDACMNYRVIFVDNDGEKALRVFDFRCLGYEYLKYCGENFIRCGDCGILTQGNKNGTKRYCKKCSGVSRMEVREVKCVDCGILFDVSSKDTRTCRCSSCGDEYRRVKRAAAQRARRMKPDQMEMN